jgi:hypothetical protein
MPLPCLSKRSLVELHQGLGGRKPQTDLRSQNPPRLLAYVCACLGASRITQEVALFVCVNKKPRPDQAEQSNEPRRRSQIPRKVRRCFRPWGPMGPQCGHDKRAEFQVGAAADPTGHLLRAREAANLAARFLFGRGVTILGGYEYNSPEVSLFERFAFSGSGLWTSALSCRVPKIKSALKLHTGGSVRL